MKQRIPFIKDKDVKKEVVRLCRTYNLTLVRGKKGIKLYKGDTMVGCAHLTLSDRRALENFVHEVEGRINGKELGTSGTGSV